MAKKLNQWKAGPKKTKDHLNEMVDQIDANTAALEKLANYPAQMFTGVQNGALCKWAIPSMLIEVEE